jgi:hypothetical protein
LSTFPLQFGEVNIKTREENSDRVTFFVPVSVKQIRDVRSIEAQIKFQSQEVRFVDMNLELESPWLSQYKYDESANIMNLAMAGPNSLSNAEIAVLEMELNEENEDLSKVQIEASGRTNEEPISKIDEVELLDIPKQITLQQNYPNPFNPLTTITYGIPSETNVRIDVYDIQGRKISTLVNTTKEPGMYQVEFNGGGLASGVYFYSLQTSYGNRTRKFTILK